MLQEATQMFNERQDLVAQKKPVGKVDYKLNSKVKSLQQDVQALEKLHYLYNNDDAKYNAINAREKARRVNLLDTLFKSWKTLNNEINIIKKEASGTALSPVSLNTEDTQQDTPFKTPIKHDLQKGADGEYHNTRGMDSQMLLQQ